MSSAIAVQAGTSPAFSPMRRDAWLLIATFFLWVMTFLSLAPLLGSGGPPQIPQTAAEAVQQIDGHRAGNIIVNIIGNVAFMVGVLPLINIGRQNRTSQSKRLATLSVIAAVAALVVLVFHSYLRGSLSLAYPPNYLPMADRVELYANNTLSNIAMIVWTGAIALTGVSLARQNVLKRTGWVVAVLGVILALLMTVAGFGIPFVPALLSTALGVGLLLRK